MTTRKRSLRPTPCVAAVTGLAGLVLIGGCREPSTTGWRGQVRDSAGVSITENPAQGVWTETERLR